MADLPKKWEPRQAPQNLKGSPPILNSGDTVNNLIQQLALMFGGMPRTPSIIPEMNEVNVLTGKSEGAPIPNGGVNERWMNWSTHYPQYYVDPLTKKQVLGAPYAPSYPSLKGKK